MPVAMLGTGETKTNKTGRCLQRLMIWGKETHMNRVVKMWPREVRDAMGARQVYDTGCVARGGDARTDSGRIMGVS